MQLFVRGYCTMIAAPVRGDVDGIPKRAHYLSVIEEDFMRSPGKKRLTYRILDVISALRCGGCYLPEMGAAEECPRQPNTELLVAQPK